MEKLNGFSFLILTFCIISQGICDDCSSVRDLKNFITSELGNLNIKVSNLERENREKGEKIKNLEEEISQLKGENGPVHRDQRQSRNLVAFTAYHARHIHSITKSQNIVYDQVLLNDGNAYDSATGVFTAPVSGVYLFSYSVGAKNITGVPLSQYDVFTRLVVNGVHQLSAIAESTAANDDEQSSTTAILFVLEGDRVWTILEFKGGNNLYSSDSERLSSFTGTLLYERTVSGIIG